MKVYIPTAGEYDDYDFGPVYLQRENAERSCCPGGCVAKRGQKWPNGAPYICKVEEMDVADAPSEAEAPKEQQ